MINKQEIPDLFPTFDLFNPRIPCVSDTLSVANESDLKKGTRQQTVGMRFFDFLEIPNWSTFSGLNLTGAWFVMQPYFGGTTWLYAADMFKKYKRQLSYVGFSETSVNNILMNVMYNFYFQSLGAVGLVIPIDAG